MGDEGDSHTSDRRRIEARLAELERRLSAAEREPLTPDDHSAAIEAEVGALREALDDLASDVFDLRNQMSTLVSACERILAGAAGGGLDITLDRDIGARGSGFVVRRAARRAVRATLGAARRVLGSGEAEESTGRHIELKPAATPASVLPKLAVIVPTDDDPTESDAPALYANQTDSDTSIVVWNPESGVALVHGRGNSAGVIQADDRRSLVEQLGAAFLALPVNSSRTLLPTVLEICRWTLASEGIPLIVGGFPARGRSRTVLAIHRAEDWSGGDDTAGSFGSPPVVKLVGAASRTTAASPGDTLVWSEGGSPGGYLLANATSGTVDLQVAALDGAVSTVTSGDPRPHVLVMTPLAGGAFDLTMWLLRGLGDAIRFSVLLTEDCGEKARLVRAMAELEPEVYPLANFLEPSVWPSVAADLARARGVTTILRVGAAGGVELVGDDGPPVIDLPLDSSEVGHGAGTLVALGEAIASRARQAGMDIVTLTAAPSLPPEPPDPEMVETVRSGLGVPTDHRLVVGIADLVSGQRPEDFVAVAHRMRHRSDTHFLLVGEGELVGTVSDIARYYGLENFTLAPQTNGTFELVLAADIVMSTADSDPWPTASIAALALGRYLVATDVEGRRELVSNWPDDRTMLVQPGDVAGLAGAVETTFSGMRKPRATKKAWKAAQTGTSQGLRLMAEVLSGGSNGAKGDS